MNFAAEREIMPGVYFSENLNISKETSDENTIPSEQLHALRELPTENIIFELSNLKNSLIHLHTSNDEMEKLVEEDKELASYIVENIQYMAKIRIKVNKMEEILQERGQLISK